MHRQSWGGIRGILFDAVGTLIEPVPSVTAAYAAAAERQGLVIDRDEIRGRFRVHFSADESDERRGPLSTDEQVERRRWRKIVHGVLPELPDPDLAFDELWEHFARPDAWRVFPDVPPALLALKSSGIRVSVASNFDARLRAVLRGLPELAELAGTPVISSEVGYRKPHPFFYEAGCRNLGLAAGEILFVGDDAENDLHGPARAGLASVLIDRSASPGNGTVLTCLGTLPDAVGPGA